MKIGKALSNFSLGVALVLGACHVPSAKADPILFNPTGGASTPTFLTSGLGFGGGNALAIGAITPGQGVKVGTTFTLLYQTHLTSLLGVNAVPGLNTTFQITEVATFKETVTSVTTDAAGNVTATFALAPDANNRISIYENNAVVFNDAAGTGFVVGTEIARLNPSRLISSQFTDTTAANGLTQFNKTGAGNGANDPTFQSTQGSGSTNLASNVNFTLSNFFVSQPIVSSLLNSDLSAVFATVNASTLFTNLTTGLTVAPANGPINGLSTPNFQIQLSGLTQSFAVPEPASVAMTVLGLAGASLGSVAARRRKVKASA